MISIRTQPLLPSTQLPGTSWKQGVSYSMNEGGVPAAFHAERNDSTGVT